MRYYPAILILFLIPCSCFGQTTITLRGSILDAENGKPIPYAHLGLPAEHIGTASTRDGTFRLELNPKFRDDTLQVSAIGYQTKHFPISTLLNSESHLNLQPKNYQMEPVTVTGSRPKTKWIGKKVRPMLGSGAFGLARGGGRYGAAYAFRVSWGRSLPLKLLHARLFLTKNNNYSLKIRCTIAAVDSTSQLPGENLIQQAAVTTSAKDKGWITCDFNRHDLYIKEEQFYVVFEWLTDKNEVYAPMFTTGLFFNSQGYRRTHAMGEWKKAPAGLIYSLKVEY